MCYVDRGRIDGNAYIGQVQPSWCIRTTDIRLDGWTQTYYSGQK